MCRARAARAREGRGGCRANGHTASAAPRTATHRFAHRAPAPRGPTQIRVCGRTFDHCRVREFCFGERGAIALSPLTSCFPPKHARRTPETELTTCAACPALWSRSSPRDGLTGVGQIGRPSRAPEEAGPGGRGGAGESRWWWARGFSSPLCGCHLALLELCDAVHLVQPSALRDKVRGERHQLC